MKLTGVLRTELLMWVRPSLSFCDEVNSRHSRCKVDIAKKIEKDSNINQYKRSSRILQGQSLIAEQRLGELNLSWNYYLQEICYEETHAQYMHTQSLTTPFILLSLSSIPLKIIHRFNTIQCLEKFQWRFIEIENTNETYMKIQRCE